MYIRRCMRLTCVYKLQRSITEGNIALVIKDFIGVGVLCPFQSRLAHCISQTY